jgi:hypothetical protein
MSSQEREIKVEASLLMLRTTTEDGVASPQGSMESSTASVSMTDPVVVDVPPANPAKYALH